MTAGIAEVSLARPEPLEAWLCERLAAVAEEPDARVVILDATDPGNADSRLSPADLRRLALFELPTVFVFEGALTGGVAEAALAADIRICSEAASLRGRVPWNPRARTLAGEGTALTLFLGRAEVAAEALFETGLVSSVTPAGEALNEARRTAEVIASRGPIATRFGKEAIWRGLAQPLEQALRFETDLTLLLQTTKDRAEGVRAFLEKRTPTFTGE